MVEFSNSDEIKKFYSKIVPNPKIEVPDSILTLISTDVFTEEIANKYLTTLDPNVIMPYFLDYLQRKDLLSDLVSKLYEVRDAMKEEEIDLNVRDLVVAMTHNQSPYFQNRIFWYLVLARYPIPILYPYLYNGEIQLYCSTVAFNFLLSNIGLPIVLFLKPNNNEIKCTSLAAKLFNFDTKRIYCGGVLQRPSIDAYFAVTKSKLDYRAVVVDANGWSNNKEFTDTITKLSSIASLVLINATPDDIGSENLGILIGTVRKGINSNFGKFIVLIRGSNGKSEELIKKFGLHHENVEIQVLKDSKDEKNPLYLKNLESFINLFWTITYKAQLDKMKGKKSEIEKAIQNLADPIMIGRSLEEENKFLNNFDENKKESLANEIYPLSRAKGKQRKILNKISQMTFEKSTQNRKIEAEEIQNLLNKKEQRESAFHDIMLKDEAIQLIKFFNSKELYDIFFFDNKIQIKQAELYQHFITKLNQQREIFNEITKSLDNLINEMSGGNKGNSIALNDVMRSHQIEKDKLEGKEKDARKELKKTLRIVAGLDVGFNALCQEIMFLKETKPGKDASKKQILLKFQEAYVEKFLKGMEIQILKGTPLFIACEGFNEIIKLISDRLQSKLGCKRLSVVSMIGDQSSCKCTLMNYLSGSNFPSSEGKCTKGINCRLANFGNGHFVLFLDTEGLQSLESDNNQIFDNQLSVFAMIVSQIVIFNLKGDISVNEENLLQVCLFAFKHLNPRELVKPTIIFTLQDKVNESVQIQNLHFSLIRKTLRDKLFAFHINLDELIVMEQDNIFLMESAISVEKIAKETAENEPFISINAAKLTEGFAKKTKDVRKRIKDVLEQIDINNTFRDMQEFYKVAESCFVTIIKYGVEICNFEVISKLEMRDKIRQTSLDLLSDQAIKEEWNKKVKLYEDNIIKSNNKIDVISNKTVFDGETCTLLTYQNKIIQEKLINSLNARKIAYDANIADEEKNNINSFLHRLRNLMIDFINGVADRRLEQLEFDKLEKELNEQVAGIKNREDKEELEAINKNITDAKNRFAQSFFLKQEIRSKDLEIAEAIAMEFNSALRGMVASKNDLRVINSINKVELLSNLDKNPDFGEKDWLIPGKSYSSESEQIMQNTLLEIKAFLDSKIPDIVNEFKDIHSIWDCMSPFIDKVNELSTNIIKKFGNDHCTIFSAALQNGIFRLILPKVFIKIRSTQDEKQNNDIKEREIKIEKIYKQVQGYLQARNDKEFGVQIGKSIADNVEENIIEEFGRRTLKYLLTFLQKTWANPEAVVREAFRISFVEENFPNVLKFLLDVEIFIKEIVSKKIDESIADFFIDSNVQMKEEISEALREILTQFDKMKTKFKSVGDAYEILKKCNWTKQINEKAESLKAVAINASESFYEGVRQPILSKRKEIMSSDNLIKHAQNTIKTADKEEVIKYYVGCTTKCYLCGAKCIKERNHFREGNIQHGMPKPVENDHQALHQLCVFGGWTYAWFQTPMVFSCAEATQGISFDSFGKGMPMLKYIEAAESQWLNDLRISQLIGTIETLKRGWANARLPYQKFYSMTNFATKDILDLVVEATQLPSTYLLPGYLSENILKRESPPPLVDVVFLLDCTGSMALEINKAKESIDKIMTKLKDICGSDIKIGFVGYRDHPKDLSKLETAKLTIFMQLNNNLEEVKSFISKEAIAIGGDDFAEAVADGLQIVNAEVNWRPNSRRFVFHIFDAPPHGREYLDDPNEQDIDFYQDGCICKQDCPTLLRKIEEKGIKYCLIAVRHIERLRRMKNIFQQNYSGMFYVELSDATELVNHITWLMSKRVGIPQEINEGQNPH